jgi:peptidoglycan-N-acetylglucosamine deacetylase
MTPMAVRLTFDDGPDPVWSPQVLDALDSAGVTATFFVVGSRILRHPHVVEDACARGHSIQPHCWDHAQTHRTMTGSQVRRDLRQTLSALRSVGVPRPSHWRPPGGAVTPDTREVAAEHGLRIALWHVDPEDWRPDKTADMMLQELRSEAAWRAAGDSIVVLHDGRINTPKTTAENTVAIIEPLVTHIRDRGWKFGVLEASAVTRWRNAVSGVRDRLKL